jgi:predicted SnoaL-like aldol condensation-catalyzing enzyme
MPTPTGRALVLALAAAAAASALPIHAQAPGPDAGLEENKRLARAFYEDLWFSRNTDKYRDYVADTYVVHDTGDRKGMTEPAIEQKRIADFFWANGALSGEIDYQIAEGDLVATRWRARMEPSTFLGRFLFGGADLPIINVFRFRDGKIVEIWNHRHDIDTGQTWRFTLQGLAVGLGIALLPTAYAFVLRRRLRSQLAR